MIKSKKEAMKDVGMTYPHLIKIQKFVEVVDEYDTPLGSEWEDVATIWASVEPISGREYIMLQNTNSELTLRIKMRYRPGITSAMRVKYGERTFNIQSVIDYKELHREMHLMCIESGDK